MPFKKNLITDCLTEPHLSDDQTRVQTDQAAVNCDNFESLVNNLLDDRICLSSDRLLQVHSDDCSSCQRILRQYEELELVLGSGRGGLDNVDVKRRDAVPSYAGQPLSKSWFKLPTITFAPIAIVTALVVIVISGQNFNGGASVHSGSSVAVAAAKPANTSQINSFEAAVISSRVLAAIEPVAWSQQSSVRQLKGLVSSGGELFAAGREQAAFIHGLSDVRLDLDVVEARLAALQPMLTYSGRIPVLSQMQGTVCFTLGWLRKDRVADQPNANPARLPDAEADLGMYSLTLRDLA